MPKGSLCEAAGVGRPSRAAALTSAGAMRRLPALACLRPGRGYGDFLANTKSAEKAARQAEKHRARNVALRSRMRTAVRDVTTALGGGNKEAAQSSYNQAVPIIDSLVSKQIIHRNKAARHKRSEEHTSELQSPDHLVCRLLLEKKKKIII